MQQHQNSKMFFSGGLMYAKTLHSKAISSIAELTSARIFQCLSSWKMVGIFNMPGMIQNQSNLGVT
jgi:hypothetical protein